MCGIALIYRSDRNSEDTQPMERMIHALWHRGPDDRGLLVRGRAALGHTRLSIVDPPGGHQPMLTDDQRLAIVFNGEIYNYRELRADLERRGVAFRTRTDTEVVLQLFRLDGRQCLKRLRGMFAFAIHDRDSNCLFVARDRLGIKPLYYHWGDSTLVAASEMKALFASGLVDARLDLNSVANYFIYQFAITPHTSFQNVRELPAGHYLWTEPGKTPQLVQYWDLEFPRDGDYESTDEAFWLKRFADGFDDAVTCHAIGDVPIGAYLSGGVDSASVAWKLSRHLPEQLQTFSIGFTNEQMDESPLSRGIAGHLGVSNSELRIDDSRESFLGDLTNCIYHLEQPQRMAVDIPHFLLSGLVRDNGYKVVYTGDGSDEILAGYDCFRQDYMRVWGNGIADPEQRKRHYLEQYTQWFSEDHVRLLLEQHEPENQQRVIRQFGCYPVWYDFWQFTAPMLPGLFQGELEQAARDNSQMPDLAAQMKPHLEGRHPLNQSLYMETKTRLPGWILWKSDRLSMAHGVEARVPFMDHPLVELAARMPPNFKLKDMDEKYVLRKLAMPHLPQHPTHYKKRAFYTPIREWFFTAGRTAQLDPYLSPQALADTGMFNVARVAELRKRLVEVPAPQSMNDQFRIMQLEWTLMLVLTVQILHRQFVEGEAPCFHGAPAAGRYSLN